MDASKKRKAAPQAPATAEQPSQDAKRKPAAVIRVDDCSATIRPRTVMIKGEQKMFFSVTLERSYKDRDGAWKYTRSFDADSLGKIVSLCQQASETIAVLTQKESASETRGAMTPRLFVCLRCGAFLGMPARRPRRFTSFADIAKFTRCSALL